MADPLTTAFMCLAVTIYFEGRGESFDGKWMIAESVINRVNNRIGEFRNQNTVCDVIKKPRAYSFYWDGKPDIPHPRNKIEKAAWEESKAIAWSALDGIIPGITPGVLWYHRIDIHPKFAESDTICMGGIIGNHVWYHRCQEEEG